MMLAAAVMLACGSAIAADAEKKPAPERIEKKKCDPSKIYVGPRGGRYHYTKNCTKRYLSQERR